MAEIGSISVGVQLTVTDDTAETCMKLLEMYCDSNECNQCALYMPIEHYCEFKHTEVDNG